MTTHFVWVLSLCFGFSGSSGECTAENISPMPDYETCASQLEAMRKTEEISAFVSCRIVPADKSPAHPFRWNITNG